MFAQMFDQIFNFTLNNSFKPSLAESKIFEVFQSKSPFARNVKI